MKCIIDSGATSSVLSSNMVKLHNIPLSKQKVKISTADGGESQCIKTEFLPVVVTKRFNKMQFVVTELRSADALLGLDWINHHDIMCRPANKL